MILSVNIVDHYLFYFCDQVLSELMRNFYSCECAMYFQLLNICVQSEIQLKSAIC